MKKKMLIYLLVTVVGVAGTAGCGADKGESGTNRSMPAADTAQTETASSSDEDTGGEPQIVVIEDTTTPGSLENADSTDSGEADSSDNGNTDGADNGKAAIQSNVLGEDPYGFQMQINDTVYTFPMTYADFTALGWSTTRDHTQEMEPNEYTSAEPFTNGDLTVYAYIFNNGVDTLPMTECKIGGLEIDDYAYGDSQAVITLPKGISFGKASEADIVAAYGDPTSSYDGDSYKKLTYEYDFYRDIELEVSGETQVLNSVIVRNLVMEDEETDKKDSSSEKISTDPTAEVTAYKAPTALGDDLKSFVVEYDGDLYQLPAPLSTFLDNGWTLDEDKSETAVKAGAFGWVYMRKNNQEYHTMVKNYGDKLTSVQNCFVNTVKGDTLTTNVPVTIQKGITIGMSEADLKTALQGVDGVESESSSLFNYYTITAPSSSLDRVNIGVSRDDGKVFSIEVSNTPKNLE